MSHNIFLSLGGIGEAVEGHGGSFPDKASDDHDRDKPDKDKDDYGDKRTPKEEKGKGDVSMHELLVDLLGALGISVPECDDKAEFERALYQAVLSKIKELTGHGGGGEGAPGDKNRGGNPLLQGSGSGTSNALLQQEQQPMYMSLAESALRGGSDRARQISLSVLDEGSRLTLKARSRAKVSARQREERLLAAYDARDARINRALRGVSPAAAAQILRNLSVTLNDPGMAFAVGDDGNVSDPADALIAKLEQDLAAANSSLTPTERLMLERQMATPTPDEDELVESFARMMGAPPRRA